MCHHPHDYNIGGAQRRHHLLAHRPVLGLDGSLRGIQNPRSSLLPCKRKRAYILFHNSCEILDELGKNFLSARVIAKLALDNLHEVERVTFDKGEPSRPDINTEYGESGEDSDRLGGIVESVANEADQSSPVWLGGADLGNPAVTSMALDQADQATSFDLATLQDFGGTRVFGNFDPEFDLDNINAIFSATLEPTVPRFLENWTMDNSLV